MLLDKKKNFDLKSLNDILIKKNAYRNFFTYIMGVLIGGIAVSVLYAPYGIVTSGSTGIAILLTKVVPLTPSSKPQRKPHHHPPKKICI